MSSRSKRGVTAWLVTWEYLGDHARPKERIAAILSPRLSEKRVRELVEFIYLNASFTLTERIRIMKNPKMNPYPAQFDSIDGIPWGGRIICGHNPWLLARMVDNLRVVDDGEDAVWDERPIPKLIIDRVEHARREKASRGS